MRERILFIYDKLFEAFGPQQWWPGDTSFEVCVGAILTQNTSWSNVKRAIENLANKNSLDVKSMDEMSPHVMAEIIRPAGYYNIKTKRLKNFISFLVSEYGGNVNEMAKENLDNLRKKLLKVNGIGPETADTILLYACEKPIFVIDSYTIRALYRHDIIDADADYYTVQQLFMDNLPGDTSLFNEFHALWVALGKNYCRKSKPLCDNCPVKMI